MSSAGYSVTQRKIVPDDSRSAEALFTNDPRLSPDASFHAVGARGMIFDARRQKLYALNRSAGFLWCCLAEGYTPAQTARVYATHANIPLPEAEEQLANALRSWESVGLASTTASGSDRSFFPSADSQAFVRTLAPPQASPSDLSEGELPEETIVCRILDTTIAVACADRSLANAIAPVLDGFGGGRRDRLDARLDVIHAYRGRVALIHGGAARWVGLRSRLAPMVFATLVRLALERCTSFPAIHAAAVLGTRGAVLLAGPSGCGKSTLAAALLASRHKVLCDDTVVLDMESMRVRAVAPVISLKSGSWHAVEGRLPRIRRQPGYQRPDGALVRFLALDRPVPDGGTPQPRGLPVRAIVFPRYRPDRPSRLRPIGTAAALSRLAPCVDPIGHRLQMEHVHRIIRWVGETGCYALSLDSLDDASAAVGELLA